MAARDQLKKALTVTTAPPDRRSFLSYPIPECSCTTDVAKRSILGDVEICPEWLKPSPLSPLVSDSGKGDEAEDGSGAEDDTDADLIPEPNGPAAGLPDQDDEMDPDD